MDKLARDSQGGDSQTAAAVIAEGNGPRKPLTPAAERALAEAAERRRIADAARVAAPVELGGRAGPDPVRFGDWEKGGICWDF